LWWLQLAAMAAVFVAAQPVGDRAIRRLDATLFRLRHWWPVHFTPCHYGGLRLRRWPLTAIVRRNQAFWRYYRGFITLYGNWPKYTAWRAIILRTQWLMVNWRGSGCIFTSF
jgi:hypothetical protein